MMRKRIVCLISHMDQGGAQEALLRLGRELRARGHDIETWFLYQKSSTYRNEPNIRVMLQTSDPGALGYSRIFFRLIDHLRAHKPDAVISFLPLANIMGQLAAGVAGTHRRIASQRNPGWSYSTSMQWLDKLAGSLGCYTANVGNSQSVVDSFSLYPDSYRRHLTVVHNGIDWTPSALDAVAARAKFGLPDQPIILNIGRLAEQKNQSLLLHVLDSMPKGHLVLAGDGEDMKILKMTACCLCLPSRVTFLGEVSRADIPDLLRAADIFAMPTRYEGQSNALLEAMHAGIAIVSSNIPSQRETLGDAGILLPLNDTRWIEALTGLIDNPERRAVLSTMAQHRARQFTAERMADGFERLIVSNAQRLCQPG